ncbi:MAG TPA: GIY-YIG nuclease family protein [Terracidiphilus sp.]|jgi:putative endonuclease|nr:GIY-YIG nuclease family protein [Terracidiphilus sp.]
MHQENYYTYIMTSRSRTLYVGMTGDLHARVFQHKWREHDGFTARYNCDRLVWFEAFHEVDHERPPRNCPCDTSGPCRRA